MTPYQQPGCTDLAKYLTISADRVVTTSRPIGQLPIIHALWPALPSKSTTDTQVWLGWGRKNSGQKAKDKAHQHQGTFLLLEDGFLRSVGRDDASLSVVFDDIGIYYDASQPSRLESLIKQPLTEQEHQRAQRLIALWREQRLSKYNSAPDYQDTLPNHYVLVTDQVAGDASISYGNANTECFHQALESALQDNPDTTVLLKVHPDAFTRSKAGHFDLLALAKTPNLQIINHNCHPARLLEHASKVYAVTSQIGFEALIWGKSVACFGMPFYAGWGLTQDHQPVPEQRSKGMVTLEQLVFAALVRYPRYINPETRQLCEPEIVMSWLGLQRRMRQRFEHVAAPLSAIGFSRWKKTFVRQFLDGGEIIFVGKKEKCPIDATPVVWGSRAAPTHTHHPALRIEDGFLRSSGLGADLIRPLSWVIDDLGIYYDATQPSRLEKILSDTHWSEEQLNRAEQLRQSIIDAQLSKYNLAGRLWKRPEDSEQTVILVPGQVPTDASIRLGCQSINTNSGLLTAVRENNPDAYIVYKPHPDVIAGLRKKDSNGSEFDALCDEVVIDADGMHMLTEVDEVHTLTSLMGFEALIRNTTVHCYGQPFYSGWGLTIDHSNNPRRRRNLSARQLCAGVLINYPTYVSRNSGCYSTPERVIQELADWKNNGPSKMPLWRKGLRQVLQVCKR